jgi:hypothetical protein
MVHLPIGCDDVAGRIRLITRVPGHGFEPHPLRDGKTLRPKRDVATLRRRFAGTVHVFEPKRLAPVTRNITGSFTGSNTAYNITTVI